jgi:hypothetical protein
MFILETPRRSSIEFSFLRYCADHLLGIFNDFFALISYTLKERMSTLFFSLLGVFG